jgi:NADH:ubiquinone oxidoreductase subunit 3 (subunit A)
VNIDEAVRSDLRDGGARARLRQLFGHLRRHRRTEAVPVKYYLTAMLFIVFDIEIIFLYPWAVTFNKLGAFGLVEMVTFVITVLVAYAYIWRRGGLEWD